MCVWVAWRGFIYGCMVLDLRGAWFYLWVYGSWIVRCISYKYGVYACRNYMRGRGSVGRRNSTPTVAPSQPLLSTALYPTLKIDEPILQNQQCVLTRESGRISNASWQGGPAIKESIWYWTKSIGCDSQSLDIAEKNVLWNRSKSEKTLQKNFKSVSLQMQTAKLIK